MRTTFWLLLATSLVAGCGDDAVADAPAGGRPDAALDGAQDSGALVDAGAEAGDPDAASDAGSDVALDVGTSDGIAPYSCPVEIALTLQQTTVEALHEEIVGGEPLHVVDVREPTETAGGVIEGALLFPWTSGTLQQEHGSLPSGAPLYVICRAGSRSLPAATYLVEQGHHCVFNVQGGMAAWEQAGFPTVLPE